MNKLEQKNSMIGISLSKREDEDYVILEKEEENSQ